MSVIFAVTLCALLFLCSSLKAAQSSTKIINGHAAVNSRVVPLWIAQEQGFFARNGLDAEVVFIRTGPILISALTAGRINVGYAAGEALVLAAAASGADVKLIAAFTSRFNHDVVARPGITRPEDLRGKRVGVQSIGGGIWMQALLALEHLGLEPVRDRLHIQVIGPLPQLANALEAGAIDVTVLPTVFSQPLKVRGYPVLLETRNSNIPFMNTSLFALKETVEQSPQLVERVLKGLLRALAFIHHPGNREAVSQMLARRLRVDQRGAEEAYRGALEMLDRKPYPSVEGLHNVRRMLARSKPKMAAIQVEDLIDTRILRKLDESGFIDALYSAHGAR